MMRSIKLLLATFMLFSFSTLTFADEPSLDSMNEAQIEQYCAAGKGGTREIEYCANREFIKADRQLNITYKQILAQLKKNPDSTAIGKTMRPEFIKSQRLWIAFRDAECGAHYTYYMSGTIRGLMFISCKTQLTQQREKDLRDFYLTTN